MQSEFEWIGETGNVIFRYKTPPIPDSAVVNLEENGFSILDRSERMVMTRPSGLVDLEELRRTFPAWRVYLEKEGERRDPIRIIEEEPNL